MNAPGNSQTNENLSILYQEVMTAVVRLRAGRQQVTDAREFRHQVHSRIETATSQALASGYPADDVKLAKFAVVAFLDESVLNSRNPLFADWSSKPLQEEMFGTHVAGELFYHNLQHLLSRTDSAELADLLEIYYLCLLLGFGGRYGTGSAQAAQAAFATGEKIGRIRGRSPQLSPAWQLPGETAPRQKDPSLRIWSITAAACAIVTVLLFVAFKLLLNSSLPGGA